MAPTSFLSDMRFDHDVAESTTTTPTVAQPSLWNFRQPFDPKSWPSAVTSSSSTSSTRSLLSEVTENLTHSYSSDQLASMLQRQFDEEDRRLAAERAELQVVAAAEKQRVFNCGMCMGTLPEESIARIEPCGHPFYRVTPLPSLMSNVYGGARQQPPRIDRELQVTRNLVLEIGTTQEQYEKWIDMEMAEFLVLLQCRRCGQSGYFDKEGFNEARNLQCPAEDCAYAWCKKCQQEVVPNGPEHSCDGSSAQKPPLQRDWTFGLSWSSIRTRVDVNANLQPGGIRVQLAFLLKLPV
ncbi:hypothetical protein F5888DRAFT_1807494 [Russula emetica]|nr:hypothetical protein F5888DRAFT_1807494 [Russula emetica]